MTDGQRTMLAHLYRQSQANLCEAFNKSDHRNSDQVNEIGRLTSACMDLKNEIVEEFIGMFWEPKEDA